MSSKTVIKKASFDFIHGLIMGLAAILPGISAGALSVVFGLYPPLMETVTHPIGGIKKYWTLFVPMGIGWLIGFFAGAWVIKLMFGSDETVATWLFLGFIVGTFPGLFKKSAEQGRGGRDWIAFAVSMALFGGILAFVKFGTFVQIQPDVWGFLFCGVLWGFSFVAPGMTSSAVIIAVGLYEPLSAGMAEFKISVLLPWLIGMAAIIAIFSRLVNRAFEKYYSVASHTVLGFVAASTLAAIPLEYANKWEIVFSAVALIGGAALGYIGDRIDNKIQKNQ